MSRRVPLLLTEAIYLARRSPQKRFRTACVLGTPDEVALSKGWSHKGHVSYQDFYSVHAEFHALLRLPPKADDLIAYIARINKRGVTGNAKPCASCARLLLNAGIRDVYYTVTGAIPGVSSWQLLDLGKVDFAQLQPCSTIDDITPVHGVTYKGQPHVGI